MLALNGQLYDLASRAQCKLVDGHWHRSIDGVWHRRQMDGSDDAGIILFDEVSPASQGAFDFSSKGLCAGLGWDPKSKSGHCGKLR